MFFQILKKELTGDLNNENVVFDGNWFDGFEPGFVMLPLNNVFDKKKFLLGCFFSKYKSKGIYQFFYPEIWKYHWSVLLKLCIFNRMNFYDKLTPIFDRLKTTV